ncbi:MAG: hypothetical protein NC341_02590 [Blautia sp.]|nr:hypothetical protein [Blautia sp.]
MREEIPSSMPGRPPGNQLGRVKQKHKNELLLTIYEHTDITHAELAERLRISASGLNAVVDRVCEGCGPEESPLAFEKRNKYKYYRLTDIGKRYVEEGLISVEGRARETKLDEYWNLFQAKAGPGLNGKLEHFLEQYAKAAEEPEEKEEQRTVNDFMDCLFDFYLKKPQDALSAMEHLIADEKLRDKIKAIICDKMTDRKILAPLEKMAAENPDAGYRFANSVIEHLFDWKSENIWKLNGEYEWEEMKPVIQKIESDMLRAVMNFQDGESLRRLWIGSGMNIHLAYYLEEKYERLLLKHELDSERRKREA